MKQLMAHVNHVGLGLVLSFPKLSPKAVKNNNIKHGSNDQHRKKNLIFFWNVFVFSEVRPIINFSSNIEHFSISNVNVTIWLQACLHNLKMCIFSNIVMK